MPSTFDQQQTPEVSTEPQRQALDEISRQLVEKLNTMVREQNERAERFAATQHSLSSLPATPQPEQDDESPAQAAPPPQPAKKARPLPPPPMHRAGTPSAPEAEERPLPPQPKSLWEQNRPEWLPKQPAASKEPRKAEENGCGSGTVITLIIIILIIIRSCS